MSDSQSDDEEVENKEPTKNEKCNNQDSIKKLADDVADLKNENRRLKRKISKMEDAEKDRLKLAKQTIDELEKEAEESIQLLTDERKKDRDEIQKFKNQLELAEIAIQKMQDERKIDNVDYNFQGKFLKIDKIEEEIKNQSKFNRQLTGKLSKLKSENEEKLSSTENSILQIKETISKLDVENIQHLGEKVREIIRKMTVDHIEDMKETEERAESEFRKRLAKMEMEHEMQVKLAEIANRDIQERIFQLENQQKSELLQKSIIDHSPTPILNSTPSTPKSNSMTPAEMKFQTKCIFCKSKNHQSINCLEYPKYTDRRLKLSREFRCSNCLESNKIGWPNCFQCSRETVTCSNCEDDSDDEEHFHHPFVCKFNDQNGEMRKQQENEIRKEINLPPRFPFLQ